MPITSQAIRAKWRKHAEWKRRQSELAYTPRRIANVKADKNARGEKRTSLDPSPAMYFSANVYVDDHRYLEDESEAVDLLLKHAQAGVLFGHRLIRKSADPFSESLTRLEIAIDGADVEEGHTLLRKQRTKARKEPIPDSDPRVQEWMNEAKPKRKREPKQARPESYAPIVGWVTCPWHGITYHSSYECAACAMGDPGRDQQDDELRHAHREALREREERLRTELELVQRNLERLEGD